MMKLFASLSVLALLLCGLTVSAVAQDYTVCQYPATGPQQYSLTGSGKPQFAALPLLGYYATGEVYQPLPGMPNPALAFCGPLWEANYSYVEGNMIEPLPPGAVFQAVLNPKCITGCKSGSTQPTGFRGPLILPSNLYVELSTCSDTGTTATCTMVGPLGDPSPLNLGEPYQGAVVGSTVVIQNFTPNSAYNGSWVVTASTNPPGPPFESPFTFSFTASGLGSGDCTDFELGTACIAYQQGTRITDGGIIWQYAGPQNEGSN
ncbi:MAG: hypothetical protein ABSG07_04865 [Terriglobales bacterium]|jgi:hypothetical protein